MKTNRERGTIRDGVSGFLCKQKATNPVPNGSQGKRIKNPSKG